MHVIIRRYWSCKEEETAETVAIGSSFLVEVLFQWKSFSNGSPFPVDVFSQWKSCSIGPYRVEVIFQCFLQWKSFLNGSPFSTKVLFQWKSFSSWSPLPVGVLHVFSLIYHCVWVSLWCHNYGDGYVCAWNAVCVSLIWIRIMHSGIKYQLLIKLKKRGRALPSLEPMHLLLK